MSSDGKPEKRKGITEKSESTRRAAWAQRSGDLYAILAKSQQQKKRKRGTCKKQIADEKVLDGGKEIRRPTISSVLLGERDVRLTREKRC